MISKTNRKLFKRNLRSWRIRMQLPPRSQRRKLMRYHRIVATRRGQPEVLQMIEDDLPEPATGEVRVKVLASGVAFGDVIYRTVFRGNMLTTPGYDIVGTVDKLGAGVTTLAI